MASEWLALSQSHLAGSVGEATGYCGEENNFELDTGGFQGDQFWSHQVEHDHYFIVDLGYNYVVDGIRMRSDAAISGQEPQDVACYVHPSNMGAGDWGSWVGQWDSGDFADTPTFVEKSTTPKTGRYVKIIIVETELGFSKELIMGNDNEDIIFGVSVESLEVVRYVNTDSTASGNGTTNATTGDNRAYASLNEWELAEQANLPFINIISHTVYCSGSIPDDTSVTILGWNTDADHTIIIKGADQSDFSGRIADFRIYNKGLTQAEAIALYETSAQLDDKGNLWC